MANRVTKAKCRIRMTRKILRSKATCRQASLHDGEKDKERQRRESGNLDCISRRAGATVPNGLKLGRIGRRQFSFELYLMRTIQRLDDCSCPCKTVLEAVGLGLLEADMDDRIFLKKRAVLVPGIRSMQPLEKMPDVFVAFLEKPFQHRQVERLAKPVPARHDDDFDVPPIDEFGDEKRLVDVLEVFFTQLAEVVDAGGSW